MPPNAPAPGQWVFLDDDAAEDSGKGIGFVHEF
jgi:hypothetical protein